MVPVIAGVPSSQALPGFLITALPSVLVPVVPGALAVWIQNQKKKECVLTLHTYHDTYQQVTRIAGVPVSQALLGFLITAPPPVLVPPVLGALTVWIPNQKKNLDYVQMCN